MAVKHFYPSYSGRPSGVQALMQILRVTERTPSGEVKHAEVIGEAWVAVEMPHHNYLGDPDLLLSPGGMVTKMRQKPAKTDS
jgi:hypothetical protein